MVSDSLVWFTSVESNNERISSWPNYAIWLLNLQNKNEKPYIVMFQRRVTKKGDLNIDIVIRGNLE